MNKIFVKSTIKACILLSCCFLYCCGSLATTIANPLATTIANRYTYDIEYELYETDSYIVWVMCFVGTGYGKNREACILGISLKDGILQSKEINLPANVVNKEINYTVTKIARWGEWFIVSKRTNTSEILELAVEKIILPSTIKEIEFDDFERFKNLKMINTPISLRTKSISVGNGGFNEECSSAYKDNIVNQWRSRKKGATLSAFDNHSYNNYKWSLKAGTGAGDAIPSNTNVADLHIDNPIDNIDLNNKIEASQSFNSFNSDVNTNIPTTAHTNENTFAVIISNENYRRESKVEYALSDGEIFKQYCHKTLGIPQSNIHHVNDATLNDIRAEIQWIQKVASAYNGEAKLIFYYAGHGIPDESTRSAYLLPSDGFGGDVTTGYKISDLYATLSKCPSKYTLVLLDACFSGAQRNGKMLASSRGVALKVKTDIPAGNMIVFSAASEDETAFPYKEQSHGMFTYFLLKKLQETNGNVTLGELNDYIVKNVSRRSIVNNSKSQTPTVTPSPNLLSKWRTIKF